MATCDPQHILADVTFYLVLRGGDSRTRPCTMKDKLVGAIVYSDAQSLEQYSAPYALLCTMKVYESLCAMLKMIALITAGDAASDCKLKKPVIAKTCFLVSNMNNTCMFSDLSFRTTDIWSAMIKDFFLTHERN